MSAVECEARSRRGRWLARGARLALLVLVGALVFASWLVAPHAAASSLGTVQIVSPQSFGGVYGGPIDTQVVLDLRFDPSQPQPRDYALGVVTSPPAPSDCSAATPIPGVGPIPLPDIQVADQTVSFKWPAGLGKGSYWFCATPLGTSGMPLVSPPMEGFKVLSDSAPQVGVFVPNSSAGAGIQAGSSVQVIISNWFTTDEQTPQLVLTQPGPTGATGTLGISITSANLSASPYKPGIYTGYVDLPSFAAAGTYSMTATGECGASDAQTNSVCAVSESSASFPVLAAPTPLPVTPTVVPTIRAGTPVSGVTHPGAEGDSISSVLPILAAEGAVALILFGIAYNLYRRRRKPLTQPTRRDPWANSPDESDHFRVEKLPKSPKRR